ANGSSAPPCGRHRRRGRSCGKGPDSGRLLPPPARRVSNACCPCPGDGRQFSPGLLGPRRRSQKERCRTDGCYLPLLSSQLSELAVSAIEPTPTWFDVHFHLFGTPVRVSAWFWLVPGVIGALSACYFGAPFFFLAPACFLGSILVHEFG